MQFSNRSCNVLVASDVSARGLDVEDLAAVVNYELPTDIDTYQHRKEESRYAKRVGMEEIEKNDFNLNISRYVSTAQPEEEINLTTVHADLVALDQQIRHATQRHNEFLKELGLPLLP